MKTKSYLRLTSDQHDRLMQHLFPGDGNEAVALALCGRLSSDGTNVLCVNELLLVEHDLCRERFPDRVSWPPEVGRQLYERAAEKSMGIIKIHSHPGGYPEFSELDDSSDREFLGSVHAWCDDGLSHGSAVMLPDGKMFGRLVDGDGRFSDFDKIMVVGDDIRFFGLETESPADETQRRTVQAFGEKTTGILGQLTVGVVGCSGTGSWVIEQLARLGVGKLVLVDPKKVERKNLNRIIGTKEQDVDNGYFKVDAIKEHIRHMGTGTRVEACNESTFNRETALKLAQCDVLFGCMDSVEGRDWLNRIATFYLLPYFDLGVRLDADGQGGINYVCGNVNYLLPGGSSLLSRGCYTSESLRVDSLRRRNPGQYQEEMEEGYIKGASVESPAVVSVNGFCATMAVNEFLARIHPFRIGNNAEERRQQFDLVNSCWIQIKDTAPCPLLSKYAGRGDINPFLGAIGDD